MSRLCSQYCRDEIFESEQRERLMGSKILSYILNFPANGRSPPLVEHRTLSRSAKRPTCGGQGGGSLGECREWTYAFLHTFIDARSWVFGHFAMILIHNSTGLVWTMDWRLIFPVNYQYENILIFLIVLMFEFSIFPTCLDNFVDDLCKFLQ